MRKTMVWAIVILLPIFLFFFKGTKHRSNLVKIGVCKVVEHEALNSVQRGVIDYLKKSTVNEDKGTKNEKKYDIVVETCQGNMAMASQIITKFINSDVDVIVTIGTIPSQAAYKFAKTQNAKVVFSSVTNPSDISPNFKGSNMTGVSNFVSLAPQLRLFKEIQPSLKKLGVVYNVGEANSYYIVSELKKISGKLQIEIVEQGISKISELSQAVEKVAKSVDAIFISNDNMALSGMSNIVLICSKKNIPVYVSDTDQVGKGCAAALGPNQYDIGVQTGKIVERIINGENVNDIDVQYPQTTELFVNTNGPVKIPNKIISRAKIVFKGN